MRQKFCQEYQTQKKSAKKIQSMGAKCVIITGATSSNGKISDFILEESKEYVISGKKIPIKNHGSGCNYSASIAVSLAKGNTMHNAVKTAKDYVYQSIRNSKKIGKGVSITHKKYFKWNEGIIRFDQSL